MTLRVPAFDGDGLRASAGVEPPSVVEAEAAGFEAEDRGRGVHSFGIDDKLQAFEAFEVGATPEKNGCAHAQGSFCSIHESCSA